MLKFGVTGRLTQAKLNTSKRVRSQWRPSLVLASAAATLCTGIHPQFVELPVCFVLSQVAMQFFAVFL